MAGFRLGRLGGIGGGLLALAQALQASRQQETETWKTGLTLADLLGKGEERRRESERQQEELKLKRDAAAAKQREEETMRRITLGLASPEEFGTPMDPPMAGPQGRGAGADLEEISTRLPTLLQVLGRLGKSGEIQNIPPDVLKFVLEDPKRAADLLQTQAGTEESRLRARGLETELPGKEDKAKFVAGATPLQREQLYGTTAATPMPTPAGPGDVSTMRQQFNQLSKEFVVVRDSYGRIQATTDDTSAAGDLALIFSYMKILDPNSVVRETEFANAQNAAGVPDQIRNLWNRLMTGERLNPGQRQDFLRQSTNLFQAQLSSHLGLEQQYRQAAASGGLPPDQVVLDFVGKYRTLTPKAQGRPEGPTRQPPGTGLKGTPSVQDLLDEARRRGLVQ